jgi:hypothetical protein
MMLNADDREFPGSEKERVWNRYWRYHSGSLIPAWLDAMVSEDVLLIYHERVFYKRHHAAWNKGWFYLGCAIELEHRAAPAQTLRELRRLVAKVLHAGYDFAAAKSLDEEVTRLHGLRTQEIYLTVERWLAERPQRLLDAHPAAIELRQEIESKRLPQGAAANLELMRAILGIEKK